MIAAGKMRHRLTFQSRSETSDGTGAGGTVTWTDTLADWPAERWSVSGSERVEAARTQQNSIFRWHCRYSASIVPSMRIKWVNAGVTHYQEMIAVNIVGNRGDELEIFAEEKN